VKEAPRERVLESRAAMARALIVDDSRTMRRSVMFALQKIPGMVCVEAQDGVDGLKKFSQGKFDVVLTDINMPLMDGLKLVNHIRSDPSQRELPIVVITTESAVEDRQKAMSLGASAYLIKPVQAQAILDTVKGLLNLS
jgi:two-component system chemotaxis response regulator CheY